VRVSNTTKLETRRTTRQFNSFIITRFSTDC
jgi:hypothetical protein